MRLLEEIPKQPYAEIVRILLDAGAPSPSESAASPQACSVPNSASTSLSDPAKSGSISNIP